MNDVVLYRHPLSGHARRAELFLWPARIEALPGFVPPHRTPARE